MRPDPIALGCQEIDGQISTGDPWSKRVTAEQITNDLAPDSSRHLLLRVPIDARICYQALAPDRDQ